MRNAASFYTALQMVPPREAAALSACAAGVEGSVFEIRIYTDKAVVFVTESGPLFCLNGGGVASFPAADRLRFAPESVYAVVNFAADQALFLREKELKNAYLTKNGCRVAVCGFSPEGKPLGRGVSSVSIRIPCPGTVQNRDPLLQRLLADSEGLLVAGPPACGKTTFLKGCVALLAGEAFGWRRVAVVDERDEFFPFIQNDPALITADVIRGQGKAQGIQTALRLFSPEYIICDEIGSAAETAGMLEGLNSGVRFIASIHAADRAQLRRRSQFSLLWEAGVFTDVLFLSARQKGCIRDRFSAGDAV